MTTSALAPERADASSRWHAAGCYSKGIATEQVEAAVQDRERGLVGEISGLADRVRHLQRTDAVTNQVQTKVLSGDLRAKWDDMRALRAPPVSGDVSLRRRGHYDQEDYAYPQDLARRVTEGKPNGAAPAAQEYARTKGT